MVKQGGVFQATANLTETETHGCLFLDDDNDVIISSCAPAYF